MIPAHNTLLLMKVCRCMMCCTRAIATWLVINNYFDIIILTADKIGLHTILNFFTGADEAPPMGFPFSPELNFNGTDHYPTASTCAVQLTLPTKFANYCDFKKSMDTGFLFHGGFGLH